MTFEKIYSYQQLIIPFLYNELMGVEKVSYDDIMMCYKVGGYYNIDKGIEDNLYAYDTPGVNDYSTTYSDGKEYFYKKDILAVSKLFISFIIRTAESRMGKAHSAPVPSPSRSPNDSNGRAPIASSILLCPLSSP